MLNKYKLYRRIHGGQWFFGRTVIIKNGDVVSFRAFWDRSFGKMTTLVGHEDYQGMNILQRLWVKK